MENNFKWTDKSVLAFNQVYASNFESKLLAHTKCSYANYVGKKAEEKLEQFKKSASDVCSIHFDLGGTGASARFSNCLYQMYDAVLKNFCDQC